jgi:hypothetical protein
MTKKQISRLIEELRKTLKNNVCRFQCLDNAQDRRRVLKEISKTLIKFK